MKKEIILKIVSVCVVSFGLVSMALAPVLPKVYINHVWLMPIVVILGMITYGLVVYLSTLPSADAVSKLVVSHKALVDRIARLETREAIHKTTQADGSFKDLQRLRGVIK